MKKNSLLSIFVVLLAVLTIVSCGSKGPKSSEGLSDDGKAELIENLNYRKACELKDFETAYQIVDKLKKKTSDERTTYDDGSVGDYHLLKYQEAKKISDEAERYVVLQEAMQVLESDGANSLMRIVGIAKEHKVEGWLYEEMADLAHKIGDTELEEKFNNMKPTGDSEDLEEGELRPSQTSISGPLNGYFTIVDKKYKLIQDKYGGHVYIEFERTKKGFPVNKRSQLALSIEYLDKKEHVIEKKYKGWCSEEMMYCNVGEAVSVQFSTSKNSSVSKFRILSQKEY